jgi:hypothetical protein
LLPGVFNINGPAHTLLQGLRQFGLCQRQLASSDAKLPDQD